MSILTASEQRVAQQIIDQGHAMAAKSFSMILQQPITAQTSVLRIIDQRKLIPIKNQAIKLVTTELMGEIQGKSFLLLNKEDCKAISQLCISPNHTPEGREIMEEAIIKEIDNIISAAVITEFSNQLRLNIYGDVPHLFCESADTMQRRIQSLFSNYGNDQFYLFASTSLLSENNLRLQPHFLWKLSASFLQSIKDHTKAISSTS